MDPAMPEPADAQMNQTTATPFDGRQYDQNGNLIDRAGLAAITYDYRNQMVQYTDLVTGQQHLYKYDALGVCPRNGLNRRNRGREKSGWAARSRGAWKTGFREVV